LKPFISTSSLRRTSLALLFIISPKMAWGGNSERRDEGDDVEDAEEELDEAVSCPFSTEYSGWLLIDC
jgi:hypothetical protein